MSRENHLLRTKNWPGNYWRTKKFDITQWSVTCIIILPMVLPNVAKGSETNFFYINIIRPPAKTKWKPFNALFVENVFRKSKILGSIVIISIKTITGSLVNHVVEIKHLDHTMPFSEWSCDICKEPYPHSRALKVHIKWVNKTKQNHFVFYVK